MSGIPSWLDHAASRPHWERIGVRKRAGVCVPLFSLRSDRACGVGDVYDLHALADWCAAIGAEVIQILPVNDQGMDSCPYAALSAFALDPVFIALDRLEPVAADPELAARVQAEGQRLNAYERVAWPEVRRVKMGFLDEAARRADGPELRAALDVYRRENPWLDEYVAFRVIKEVEEFRSWEDWGPRYADPAAVDRLLAERADRVLVHRYAQFCLDRQFREARAHANAKGVLIEGDVPILVSRDSHDVWRHPELFRLDGSAGAPPDMYAADGQNWGFPTYDWEALRGLDYRWWRERLRHAGQFFNVYRIDHVVGFFRIWTVPAGERTGRNGRFVPGDEAVWGEHGRSILRMMLASSPMLPLAEDLGTIPDICRATLKDLGICGFKVQRWEKRWHGDRRFIPVEDYIPLSMATLSTHDSEILAEWWQENPGERQELYELVGHRGTAPVTLPGGLHREIVQWVSGAGSLFVVHMLQELLGPFGLLPGDPRAHRVNLPGVVNDTNWTWRSPVPTTHLVANAGLTQAVREMIRRR